MDVAKGRSLFRGHVKRMPDPPEDRNPNAAPKEPKPKDDPLPIDPGIQNTGAMPSDSSDFPPGGFGPPDGGNPGGGFGPGGRPDHPPPPASPPAAPSTYTSFISITNTVISTAYPSTYSSTYAPSSIYNPGTTYPNSIGSSPTSSYYDPNTPTFGPSPTQTFTGGVGFTSSNAPPGFTSSFLRTSTGLTTSGFGNSIQTGFTITPGQTTFQTLGGSPIPTIGAGGSLTSNANGGLGGANASPTTFGFMSTVNPNAPSSTSGIGAGTGFGTEQGPTPIPEKQLAQQTKIGIGVGVGIWALISIALFTFWFLRHRNRPRPSPFQRFDDYDPGRAMIEAEGGMGGIGGIGGARTNRAVTPAVPVARPASYLSDADSIRQLPAAPGLRSHPIANPSDEDLGLPGAERIHSEVSSLSDHPVAQPNAAHIPNTSDHIPNLPFRNDSESSVRTQRLRSLTAGSDDSTDLHSPSDVPALPPNLGKLNSWLEENRRKSRMASLHDAASERGAGGNRDSRPVSVAELRDVLARRSLV